MHPQGTPDKVTIPFAMPKVGGVTCDSKGNLYVAYGDDDEAGTGKICTFAVYKYSRRGKLLGKAEYFPTDLDASTRAAFTAGNCAMEFQGDLLICSYGRRMYSEHQSNAVFCVDTATMTENPVYYCRTGHSFDQSVLVMDEHTVVFADHGDAYPRGFSINIISKTDSGKQNKKSVTPFQFYGEIGDNYTNAYLAGIAKVNTGVALVGASAKEYSAKFRGAAKQLFMQVIDVESGESILKGDTRADGSKGIVWLTNYTDGCTVGRANAAALDDSRLLVMWERWRKGEFVNSYYSIVKSDGTVVTDSVPMQYARINAREELKTNGTTAYWTYANGKTAAATYTLRSDKPYASSINGAVIKLAYEQKVYTGKAIKPAVTVDYNGVILKKGRDYTVTYKNNKNAGTASVIIKGKGSYSGKQTLKFSIISKAVNGFTVTEGTSKNTLKWKPVAGAVGYEIEIDKYVLSDGAYGYDKTITKTSKKASYVHKKSAGSDYAFSYRVRAITMVNGVKVYSDWKGSDIYYG